MDRSSVKVFNAPVAQLGVAGVEEAWLPPAKRPPRYYAVGRSRSRKAEGSA